MWTIGQLKARGKSCFQRNYWKAVLVALVISLIGGMQGSGAIRTVVTLVINVPVNFSSGSSRATEFDPSARGFSDDPFSDDYEFDFNFGNDFGGGFGNPYGYGFSNPSGNPFSSFSSGLSTAVLGMIVVFAMLIFLVALVLIIIGILVDIFLKNPLFVGTQRFFIHNLTENGMVGDMGFGFDRSYKNQVRIMFFRDLYTLGWSCLFLIPGIYKSYEYRMIPYLLAEYPQMDKEQAFYTSKFLMQGNKWRAFLLDLSFIGWWLLTAVTGGLVGVFYVNPYYVSTCAALYEALKAIKGIPAYGQPQMNFDPQTGEPVYAGAQGEFFAEQTDFSAQPSGFGETAGAGDGMASAGDGVVSGDGVSSVGDGVGMAGNDVVSGDGMSPDARLNQESTKEVAGDNFVMRSSAEPEDGTE